MAKKIIELKNIVKAYGDNVVVKGMNLYVNDNEFITFLGPSGCGKTTVLSIISGLLSPTKGQILLEGKQLDSEEIAEFLNKTSLNASRITFIIGGSLGLSDKVKQKAGLKLSFGRVTLPHQLMRVVLSEQIYRGFKILNNESYHK